jgi:hypothetical protein
VISQELVPRETQMTQDQNLMDLAIQDPLTAVECCQNRVTLFECGHHEQLYHYIAVAYAIAYQLQHNPDAWRSFTQLSFWSFRKKRLRAKDSGKALLHVMVFVFSARSKAAYDRICTYATAVETYFRDAIPCTEVAAKIKQDGGVEALMKRVRTRKSHPKSAEVDLGTSPHDHRADSEVSELVGLTRPAAAATRADHDVRKTSHEWVSADQPRELHRVWLSACPTLKRQILKLAPGEQARITVVRAQHKREGAARILSLDVQPD